MSPNSCGLILYVPFDVTLQLDVDDFFEQQKQFLLEYHGRVKDSTMKGDKMTKTHKSM